MRELPGRGNPGSGFVNSLAIFAFSAGVDNYKGTNCAWACGAKHARTEIIKTFFLMTFSPLEFDSTIAYYLPPARSRNSLNIDSSLGTQRSSRIPAHPPKAILSLGTSAQTFRLLCHGFV